jgi:aspartate-semialdehyde dehydrogenase
LFECLLFFRQMASLSVDTLSVEELPFRQQRLPEGSKRVPVGILGGTGLVGRVLARYLSNHPYFSCGPIIGSSRSVGQSFEQIWEEKEKALAAHYGDELWTPDFDFPEELKGITVASLDDLLESDVKYAISAIAPRHGFLEDKLIAQGITVASISPYKRQENILCVLEANHEALAESLAQKVAELQQIANGPVPGIMVKSPNCVCCGTTVVLRALADAFGGSLGDVSVTTMQSLSGRGDAMYPAELVVGNVYPLGGAEEPTEALIGEELKAVLGDRIANVSVKAYRVSVQRGHLVDVRVKTKKAVNDTEEVYAALEAFQPLAKAKSGSTALPTIPSVPICVNRDGGCPRPKSHHVGHLKDGLSVTVGNVQINDGVFDITLSLVVDNLAKGAYAAAVQLLEFTYDQTTRCEQASNK